MTRTARLIYRNILLCGALGTALLCSSQFGEAKEDPNPPAQARPMTAAELTALYGDKTWQWKTGAGRMETMNRRFSAIVGSGAQSSWAIGRWTVTNAGRFCFVADWYSPSGVRAQRTCFLHRIDNGTIYQRKAPSGDWYIFKHAPPQAGDEFKKLIREDLVTAELQKRQQSKRSKKKH